MFGANLDKSVVVPASTTLAKGTVLGEIVASGLLAPFKSANSDGTQVPVYVLATPAVNSTAGAVTLTNVRVLAQGEVFESELVFNGADTIDTIVSGKGSVSTLLKNAGILVQDVQDVVR